MEICQECAFKARRLGVELKPGEHFAWCLTSMQKEVCKVARAINKEIKKRIRFDEKRIKDFRDGKL